MHSVPETKKNHIWRKVVWHTDLDLHPLGPHHYAEVYCCEETNGYTVWYVRRLSREDQLGDPAGENGDYLLSYFAKDRRDDAIEHAVLIATGDKDADAVIRALDAQSKSAQKI
ncbi:MAG: hypothetical protein JO002_11420 [Burkholderiaceae bacterium]|nr:hypothetical protein [Burkholderiaceae bacterium]